MIFTEECKKVVTPITTTTTTTFRNPRKKLKRQHTVKYMLKKRSRRAKLFSNIKRFSWQLFANTTSIGGVFYAFCKQNLNNRNRAFFIFWFTMCSFLCLWQCANSVKKYYEYKIKAKTTYNVDRNEQLKFPLIGFCNEHPFIKRFFGNSDLSRFILAMITTKNTDDAFNATYQNKEYCAYKSDFSDEILDAESVVMKDIPDEWIIGRSESVITCWWQSRIIDCRSILYDIQCPDLTKCFFLLAETYEKNLGKDAEKSARVSTKFSQDNSLNVSGSGPKNGFKIMLNANQDDFCGISRKWNGVGFRIYIKSQETINCFPTSTYLTLQPGYTYSIAMSRKLTKRNTKHLGLCLDDDYATIFADSNVTVFGACVSDCMIRLILKKCDCYPPYLEGDENTLLGLLGIIRSSPIFPCSASTVQCALGVIDNFFENRLSILCPECKMPCLKEEFDIQITALKLPKKYNPYGMDDFDDVMVDIYKKNILYANFYFESKDIVDIVEEQYVNTRDLFVTYIGNSIMLFLGMSFISPFELVFQVFFVLHRAVLKYVIKKDKLRPTRVKYLRKTDTMLSFNKFKLYLTKPRQSIKS